MLGGLKNITPIGLFVCAMVIITNLSQLQVFVDSGTTQYMSFSIWGVAVLVCLINGISPRLYSIRTVIFWFAFFIALFFLLCLIDTTYAKSSLPNAIELSFFVLIMGTCFGQRLQDKDLEYIYVCYIISSLIVGYDVYKQFLVGQSIDTRVYLYESKNSLCQILLTSWILILFTKFKSSKILIRWVYILLFLFIAFEICVLKSRATIIGMPLVIFIAIMNGNLSKKVKRYSILILAGVALLLLNENSYNLFIDNIIFANRDVSDINDLSSGRSYEWANFMKDWTSPFWGIGKCKRESLILTSLLEFGIIGGVPILILGFYPIYFSITRYRLYCHNVHFIIVVVLSITYCLNGIFEQLAPFGPGVKCYFLWFMLGVVSCRYEKIKDNNQPTILHKC